MKTYRIPCIWTMTGEYIIRANSLEEAEKIAEESELPIDSDYLSNSFELDRDAYNYGEVLEEKTNTPFASGPCAPFSGLVDIVGESSKISKSYKSIEEAEHIIHEDIERLGFSFLGRYDELCSSDDEEEWTERLWVFSSTDGEEFVAMSDSGNSWYSYARHIKPEEFK